MLTLHTTLVTLHIIVGALALPLFWMPVATRKGSPVHRYSGRAYAIAMYLVSISGFIASLLVLADPIAIRRPEAMLEPQQAAALAERFRVFSLFLLMLSVLVFTSVRHGLAALQERARPGAISGPLHRALVVALGVMGLIVGVLGLMKVQWLLIIFGGVSVNAAWGMLRDIRQVARGEANLIVVHLGGLIASGIGAYTGFFAFGGARFFSEILPGQWQIVPWVLPTIVGTLAIARVSRRFQRPASAAAVS